MSDGDVLISHDGGLNYDNVDKQKLLNNGGFYYSVTTTPSANSSEVDVRRIINNLRQDVVSEPGHNTSFSNDYKLGWLEALTCIERRIDKADPEVKEEQVQQVLNENI